ncbi:protein DOWNY MILDEW RESISTANCE 6-like [Amaranthus tricolor]|uniref:protein DOWNY MILDEW RESISTANCE 6-like n=1 Tax=Amaranthus tricolor TaxID=29722 RepID=UPI00258E7D75|nr:protein DOWNY MILDEW RESISTANCE 6-like [Amaranthus tricolor]
MEKKIVSSWFNGKCLPENYIIPPEKRPGELCVPTCEIPIIDLSKAKGNEREIIIDQIMEACKKFGFFQVINHGVEKDIMDEAMKVFMEFFELPYEEKSHLYSEESNVKCRLYTSSYNYANEDIHYWRDCLKHTCTPLKDCIHYWPQKPSRYWKVVGEYSTRVRELGLRILELINEGLKLEEGYLRKGYSEESFMSVNHYPPCPDPRLTLGLPKHCDPNLITLLLQGNIPGLQVCVDNQWLLIQPSPHAFVVNMGFQMQVISNGKLKSAEHRVVTNAHKARTTAAFFILPSKDKIIQPAKSLIKNGDSPLFKQFQYADFVETFKACSVKGPESTTVLDHFKIKI